MLGRLFAAFVAALVALLPLGVAAETIHCSHQFPPQHHVTALIEAWAKDVERLSKGRIEIELVGDGKLYKPEDNILAVAKGDIECAFSLNFQWSRKLPLMTATLAPFAMMSPTIPDRWPNSRAARFLDDRMHEKGVQSLVWLFQTNQSVITSKGRHIARPEDFEGLKMRGLVPAFDQTFAQLGATVVPMNASQLYEAMRTGAIDAVVTDVAVAVSRRLYEQHDHMVVLPMLSVYVNGYVTPQWFDLLDDDLKEAFYEAGRNAAANAAQRSQEAAAAAPAALREHGVDVHVATPLEIARLRAAVQPIFRELFLKEAGPDGPLFLELIRELDEGDAGADQ